MNKTLRFRILTALVATLLLLSPISALGAPKQNLKIKFFNVGAGDSIYIETATGTDILIDGGLKSKGKLVVDQLLKEEPGMDLEYVISTHPDADHAGGLQEVFKRMRVKKFYYPRDVAYSTVTAKTLLQLAKAEPNCQLLNPKPGAGFTSGGAAFKFVHSSTDYTTSNKDSVMTYLDYGNLEVLFTADAERGAEAAGRRYNVDVLQMPHHGSTYSSSTSFIKKYDPERIVISTDGSSYGHPHQAALKRYQAYDKNTKVYRTDKNGNIILYANGTSWWFSKYDVPKLVGRYITASTTSGSTSGGSSTSKSVYVTKTGKRFHFTKYCRGLSNANSISYVKLTVAKQRGLTLCGFE